MTVNNQLNGLIVAVIIAPQCLASDSLNLAEEMTVQGENTSEYNKLNQALPFDIPGQSLEKSLDAFVEVTDWQIGFSAALTQGLKGRVVKGQFHPAQALKLMLKGSGLTYRMTGDGIVILESNTVGIPEPQIPDVDLKRSSPILRPLMLEEITVTGKKNVRNDKKLYSAAYTNSATRTDTPIKEIPQSIQIVTAAVIDDQQSIAISESLRNVSGVITNNPLLTPNFEWTLIRGFRAEQLLDGFTQYYNPGDRESIVNIERFEVLKGSNALLYSGGSGSPAGGVVNLISKLPQPESFAEVGVKVGSYQFYQPYFDVNLPINDSVLFRLTGEYTNSESHIDVLETERYNINPALVVTNNDDTTLTLQGKMSKWQQQDYQGLPATGTVSGDFTIRPKTFIGPKNIEPSTAEFFGIWGALEHTLNTIWFFTFKARYTQSEFDQKTQVIFGSDALQADQPLFHPSTWWVVNSELFQEQEEISLVGNAIAEFSVGSTENILLLGADYSQIDDQGFLEFDLQSITTVDLSSPEFLAPYKLPASRINNLFVKNTTYGGYAQIQSTLYERLHLLAGIRLGNVTINYDNTIPGFGFSAQSNTTKLLPRLGGVFDITDGVSIFANYSEGMRGQPFHNFTTLPKPELSQHFELGMKFDIAEQLTGQFSFYRIDLKNVLETDSTKIQRPSLFAKQRSQGFEADLVWQPNEAVSLLANYAYTDAEFVNDDGGVAAGTPLPGVPKHSGRFWVNYDFQQPAFRGLSVGAGIYAQSGVYLSNAHLFKSNSYYTVDASVNYEIDRFKLGVSVKNLTDQSYFERLDYYGSHVAPGQGASVITSFSIKF